MAAQAGGGLSGGGCADAALVWRPGQRAAPLLHPQHVLHRAALRVRAAPLSPLTNPTWHCHLQSSLEFSMMPRWLRMHHQSHNCMLDLISKGMMPRGLGGRTSWELGWRCCPAHRSGAPTCAFCQCWELQGWRHPGEIMQEASDCSCTSISAFLLGSE